ncbi:hypothetical protein ACLI4Y_14215 [Natrialbaceae archaeon A-CW3]
MPRREASVPSSIELDWGRALERLCFLYPPVIGVGAIGVLGDLDPGVPGVQWALFAIGSFGYTVVTIGVMVALYLDAHRFRDHPSWHPSPVVYPAVAFVAGPLVAVVYLSRRHRQLGTPAGWDGWWLVIALSLCTSVLGIASIVVAIVFQLPGLLVTAAGLAGTIAVGAFPVAIHQDAAFVSIHEPGWRPNPGTYLGLAFASLFVPVFQPLLAAYYLVRRSQTVGLEWPTTPVEVSK